MEFAFLFLPGLALADISDLVLYHDRPLDPLSMT